MNKQKNILVIEDEAAMAEAIKLRLEANGFAVSLASDGQEGLNKVRAEIPDLIILDVMLPKMNGFTLCRMLKFDEKYRKIPIIMFTAKTQQKDIKEGEEVGANAYITKPFKSEELLQKIKELLKK
ncbi:MAG: response regulator [Candidatus Margulisiibacteriota bacterium]